MFAAADTAALSHAPSGAQSGARRTAPRVADEAAASIERAAFDGSRSTWLGDSLALPTFRACVLPLLHISELAVAVPLAACLQSAGLASLVLSAANDTACEAIRQIRAALPALQIGADLPLPGFAASARAAGADYLISSTPSGAACSRHDSHLLRVRSVRELRQRLERGQQQLVLAPAQLRSGLAMLKILAAELPMQRVGIVGAIERQDLPIYLAQTNVAAVAAPWIVAPELIRRRDWSRIGQQARVAAAMHAVTQ